MEKYGAYVMIMMMKYLLKKSDLAVVSLYSPNH